MSMGNNRMTVSEVVLTVILFVITGLAVAQLINYVLF